MKNGDNGVEVGGWGMGGVVGCRVGIWEGLPRGFTKILIHGLTVCAKIILRS